MDYGNPVHERFLLGEQRPFKIGYDRFHISRARAILFHYIPADASSLLCPGTFQLTKDSFVDVDLSLLFPKQEKYSWKDGLKRLPLNGMNSGWQKG